MCVLKLAKQRKNALMSADESEKKIEINYGELQIEKMEKEEVEEDKNPSLCEKERERERERERE